MYVLFKTTDIFFTCLWYRIRYAITNNTTNCIKDFATRIQRKNYMFIKLFQSFSTNSDLLNEKEMEVLFKYNNEVEFSSQENNIDEIKKHINLVNEKKEEKIVLLNETPSNSGMISLIYEAKIGSKDVIIKIYRNKIKEKIQRECLELFYIFNYLSYLPFLNFSEVLKILNDTHNTMLSQCDIENEIDNIKKMYKLYNDVDNIRIPYFYNDYSNKKIIVMEKFKGENLMDLSKEDKKEYSNIINHFTVTSVFYKRLVHGDLHKGNIFFLKDNGDYKIGLIDFGLMIHITREQQDIYYRLIEAISLKNKDDAVEIFILELLEPQERIDKLDINIKKKLYNEFEELLESIIAEKTELDTNLIYNSVKILKDNGLKFAPFISEIELSIGVSSNICRYLSNEKPHLNDIIDIFRSNSSYF